MRSWLRNLTRGQKVRFSAISVSLVAAIILGLFGFGASGAYFSDSHDGLFDGKLGSILVTPSGGSGTDGTNFMFDNLLPGQDQTATLSYKNIGSATQDLWVSFPNPTALSSLNNLGTYGHVVVGVNGTTVFESSNLNDRSSTCGAFSPSGCWPLPNKLKLASNVAPGDTGSLTFTLGYASKLSTQAPAGTTAYFNQYPVSGQTTVNAGDGSGHGLPYRFSATEPGQTV